MSESANQVKGRQDAEKQIKRNPHPDFKSVESQRKEWDNTITWNIKQTVKPDWKYGDGANDGVKPSTARVKLKLTIARRSKPEDSTRRLRSIR